MAEKQCKVEIIAGLDMLALFVCVWENLFLRMIANEIVSSVWEPRTKGSQREWSIAFV